MFYKGSISKSTARRTKMITFSGTDVDVKGPDRPQDGLLYWRVSHGDLTGLDQLVHLSQSRVIVDSLVYLRDVAGAKRSVSVVEGVRMLESLGEREGMEVVNARGGTVGDYARPRGVEVVAVLNRLLMKMMSSSRDASPSRLPPLASRLHELDESESSSSLRDTQQAWGGAKRRSLFGRLVGFEAPRGAPFSQPLPDTLPHALPGALPHSLPDTLPGPFPDTSSDSLPLSSKLLRQIQHWQRTSPDLRPYTAHLLAAANLIKHAEQRCHASPFLMQMYRLSEVPPLSQAVVLVLVGLAVLRKAMKTHARFLSNLFGAVYPALMSILAIERPRPDDDERLLTYWSVFGLFSILDHASPQILPLLIR
ncbi:Receptor expression-enhancing protein 5, partial [Podochytrium sp. JEL0797]